MTSRGTDRKPNWWHRSLQDVNWLWRRRRFVQAVGDAHVRTFTVTSPSCSALVDRTAAVHLTGKNNNSLIFNKRRYIKLDHQITIHITAMKKNTLIISTIYKKREKCNIPMKHNGYSYSGVNSRISRSSYNYPVKAALRFFNRVEVLLRKGKGGNPREYVLGATDRGGGGVVREQASGAECPTFGDYNVTVLVFWHNISSLRQYFRRINSTMSYSQWRQLWGIGAWPRSDIARVL